MQHTKTMQMGLYYNIYLEWPSQVFCDLQLATPYYNICIFILYSYLFSLGLEGVFCDSQKLLYVIICMS